LPFLVWQRAHALRFDGVRLGEIEALELVIKRRNGPFLRFLQSKKMTEISTPLFRLPADLFHALDLYLHLRDARLPSQSTDPGTFSCASTGQVGSATLRLPLEGLLCLFHGTKGAEGLISRCESLECVWAMF